MEKITFEQRRVGGKDLIYAVHDWPKCALIAPICLRSQLVCIEEGVITITVANGFAVYELADEQLSDDAITVELSDGAWLSPPNIS